MLIDKLIFAFRKHPVLITLTTALTLIVIFLAFLPIWYSRIEWFEPVIGVFTLFIALVVWALQINNEWQDDLSKRLTVRFEYKGRYIMQCKEALLTGEADIRMWSQQIGQQMSYGSFLKFDPYFKIEKPSTLYNSEWKEWYTLHTVTFYLTENPDLPKATPEQREEWERLTETGCLHWYPEYQSDKTLIKRESSIPGQNPVRRI